MKIRLNYPRKRAVISGITLIEMLIYFSVLFVFIGIAYGTLERLWLETRHIEKRADGLRGIIQAGETWRADIRRATAPPVPDPDGLGILIPDGTNQVRWRVEMPAGIAARHAGGADIRLYPWPLKLANFAPVRRDFASGWIWEATLTPPTRRDRQPQVVRFLAVPHREEAR